MNNLQTDDNDFKYYLSLDDMKADGWSPVKVWNLLQFFTLGCRTSDEEHDKIEGDVDSLIGAYKSYNLKIGKEAAKNNVRSSMGLFRSDNSVIMEKENLFPLTDQPYVVLGTDQRYYLKTYRNYNVDTLYFYFQDKISPVDEAIEQLRSYVLDEKVWILFDKTQVDDMKKMLERVFKSKISGEGTLTYKSFIDILDLEIRLQDYRRIGANLPGNRTVVKQFEDYIADQWRKVYEKNIK